ncbi:probable glutaminase A [Serendipita indica DSM 11827]|uniref:Probable glutaminase A n=1 Tax=Serendipita indica (strain DSM 11827) TaxID=1109443 RepID=G4TBB2_SERID|nr:probable glutaminase A [Serendipita indica DSM 11827]
MKTGSFPFPSFWALWTFISILDCSHAAVSWTVKPFSPPAYPLAVRTPYLSCWLPQNNGTALNQAWPTFWTGTILGWAGYVRVDGSVYLFLGHPDVQGAQLATQKSATFTSTQSTFVLSAGGIDLTANFLSPVEPEDLTKQSLPFSYLALTAASNDGNSHSVQVYTDISAEWVTGDNSKTATWSTTTGNSIITHQISLQNPQVYGEASDHTEYGSAYYSLASTEKVTYQSGADTTLRARFIANGTLQNTLDNNFRAVNDQWPVFAFAQDVGTVGPSASDPVVFSVGHVRDPAIQYTVRGALQDRSLYFWTQYSSVAEAINAFHTDYSDALARAKSLDTKFSSDAAEISDAYDGVVSLSLRQAFAAMELTVSKNSDGSLNHSDILLFQKEISSSGNVNTVDVVFPTWPLFLYLNPSLSKYILLPYFQYQSTGLYPNAWAVHDMGASYPKAIGHNDGKDEPMPLEECGNMLIMTLSHYQRTGDISLISTYYKLLDQWTQYLIEEALIPASQISTDDFAGPLVNQTNLAIKGIVAIRAMADIECLMGNQAQSENYTAIAEHYVSKWQILALSTDQQHLTLSYGNSSSWGQVYNLFADRLLGFNLFPESIYDLQDAWYPRVLETYGIPLDTRHKYTKTDWSIWMAAIAKSRATRDIFIGSIYNYVSNERNSVPFSDWYDTDTGVVSGFRARSVVGGHFALMKGVLPRNSTTIGTCTARGGTSSLESTAYISSSLVSALLGIFFLSIAVVVL